MMHIYIYHDPFNPSHLSLENDFGVMFDAPVGHHLSIIICERM